MSRYDRTHQNESHQLAESATPLLDNLVTNVINSLDIRLRRLAVRALGTRFHPEIGVPKSALAVNSFREQWQLLEQSDPNLAKRFRDWGVGSLIDSVKQQDVNLATNRNIGVTSYTAEIDTAIKQKALRQALSLLVGCINTNVLIGKLGKNEHR